MAGDSDARPRLSPWRDKLHEIIFEADTKGGKAFDVALLIAIVVSVVAVMLETVDDIQKRYGALLSAIELVLTVLFTIEYVLRLICVGRPMRYARSFFGIVDLLAILPTYLDVLLPGDAHTLVVIRALRLLRVFRVLKLGHFLSEANLLKQAVFQAKAKILVFLATVIVVVAIMGAAMYLIEGSRPDSAFTSIPQSCYWAVVTMTTVGYGDIAPESPLGKFIAVVIMVLGYSFIIVPTGIISTEIALAMPRSEISTRSCPSCLAEGHDADAKHCKHCGTRL